MSCKQSNGFNGIARGAVMVFAILAAVVVFGAPGRAAADSCGALGGTLVDPMFPGDCVISGPVVGVRTGLFTIAETLRFNGTGKLTTAAPTGITITITSGDFIMASGTTIDGSATPPAIAAPIKVELTGGGNVDLQTGSKILSIGAEGGFIQIITGSPGTVNIDGLVQSAGTVKGTGASQAPGGGPITIIAGCALTVSDTGQVISSGDDPGADLVHLEGCTVTIDGLVASSGPGHTPPNFPPNSCSDVTPAFGSPPRRNPVTRPGKPQFSTGCVEIWSGTTLVIDSTGTHKGEVDADIGFAGGSRGIGWIDLFANGDISIDDGAGNGVNVFAVHANGGLFQNTDRGGLVTVKSTGGSVAATGNAIEADGFGAGSGGGQIFVEAHLNIAFAPATNIFAHGDADPTGGFGAGGRIGSVVFDPNTLAPAAPIRAFTGTLSWLSPGVGNVLPTGTGVPTLERGEIHLQSCLAPTVTASFPFIGASTTPGAVVVLCGAGPTLPAYATPFPLATCTAQCNLIATGKTGTKFNDLNGNGIIDPGDPPLPFWTFVAFSGAVQIASATTNAAGLYSFVLAPGTYTVCEVLLAGWTQTFPHVGDPGVVSCAGFISPLGPLGPLGYQFTLVNSVDTGNDFANHFTPPPPVCPQDPGVKACDWSVDPATPDPGGHLCTLADPHCNTLGQAYAMATNGQTICMFDNTIENAVLNDDKTLKITQCHSAKITAKDNNQPVVKITSTGVLTIIGPDTVGGTIGWDIVSSNNQLKSVRATNASQDGILVEGSNNTISINSVSGNGAGIRVTGNLNTLRSGGAVTANIGDGVQIKGNNNTVSGNQSNQNGGDGFKVEGNFNALTDDKANSNGGIGFDILGAGNTLKGNQSNQSAQGGSKENGGCEYNFAGNTTVDLGGNKKDTLNFIGTIPPPPTRRYAAGCYE